MRAWIWALSGVCLGLWAPEARAQRVWVEGGEYLPFFAEAESAPLQVAGFWMDRAPVTNAEYARFVEAHPSWAPGAPPAIFADHNYLKGWEGRSPSSLQPGAGVGQEPVTWVSWFAAAAFCEWRGGRLPLEAEWELAAAPRGEEEAAALTERLLRWYSQPGAAPLRAVGEEAPDARGFVDLHGLVWEWLADFNASMVAGARRGANERVLGLFCGGAAVAARDPRDYAALMRFAMRSSLTGRYTARTLGLRCVYERS
jgi:sulfatase modifying factor 1